MLMEIWESNQSSIRLVPILGFQAFFFFLSYNMSRFTLADKLSYNQLIRLLQKYSEFLPPLDSFWHVYSPVRVFFSPIWLC